MRQFFQRSFSPFSFILIFLLTIEILLLFSVNKKNIGNLDLVIADLRGQAETLQKDVENLAKENIALKHENLRKQLDSYNQIVGKYETVKDKSNLYKKQGGKVGSAETGLRLAIDLILGKKYKDADKKLTALDNELEKLFKAKRKADAL